MEDSEQRKKRLKEMRLQADRVQDSGAAAGDGSGTPSVLANPLAEAPSAVLSTDSAPRFNYYTDPMNAFSDKRGAVDVRPASEYLPPPPPLPLNFVPEFSSQRSGIFLYQMMMIY